MNIENEFYNLLITKGLTSKEAYQTIKRYFKDFSNNAVLTTTDNSSAISDADSGGPSNNYNCLHCGGFYAPTFGQPLCSVCHAFLYPQSASFWCNWAQRIKYSDDQKSESEDSGNEDLGPTISYSGGGGGGSVCSGGGGQKDGSGNTAVQSPSSDHQAPSSSSVSAGAEGGAGDGIWCGSMQDFPGGGGGGGGSNDENNTFVVRLGLVQAAPPDRLAEQLKALSEPRPLDRPLPEGMADRLPTEVLIKIFGHVDDLALWCCSRVSKRWQTIVKTSTDAQQWQQYVRQRWPLIQPFYAPVCWYQLYGALVEAAPCFLCLEHMQIDKTQTDDNWPGSENITGSLVSKRLLTEVRALRAEPPAGVEARPLNRQWSHWLASLNGPANSPYEGGKFLVFIRVPDSYPMAPPVVRFLTRVFHPNVNRHGNIGLDILHYNWSLALTLSKILLSVQSLLTDPALDACMEPDIGRLYTDRRTVYNCMAQMWTWKYAMTDIVMPSLLK